MLSSVILLFVIVGLIVFANKRPIYGLMFYFVIRMIIPPSARVFSLSFNTIALLFLMISMLPTIKIYYAQRTLLDRKYFHLLKGLFIGLFCLTLISFVVPKFFQFSSLIQTFYTEFIPSILLAIYIKEKEEYKMFCMIVAFIALFTSLYAIYTFYSSANPIFEFFNTTKTVGIDLEEYANDRMGLNGIAVGIYNDKIACSLICMLLSMFIYNIECISKKLRLISLCSSLVALYLTTQRTGLLCFLLFFILTFIYKNNYSLGKKLFIGIGFGMIAVLFANNKLVNDFFTLILSVFTDNLQNNNSVGGSNSEMRLTQLANCVDYLDIKNLFQGAGYGFATYYYKYIWNIELYGHDIRFLGFESFLFQTIMNSGLIGVYLWGNFFVKLKNELNYNKSKCYACFVLCYVLAILMTDASASLFLFFMLMVLSYKSQILNQKLLI